MTDDPKPQIHIAGFPVRVGTKIRQRCAWCEHVLEDEDLADIAVAPAADGSPGSYEPFWPMGALVEVRDNGRSVIPDNGKELPVSCCASQRRKLTLVKSEEGSAR